MKPPAGVLVRPEAPIQERVNSQTGAALALNEDLRAGLWQRIIGFVEAYTKEVHTHRVCADLEPREIRKQLSQLDFSRPTAPLDAIELSIAALWRFQTHTAHPRYFGLFDPAPATMAIAAEILTAVVNPQLAAWSQSPFAVEVEQHLLRLFGEKFGYAKGDIDGTFTSGGAEANHTAILTALTSAFPDFARKGIRSLSGDAILYVSSEAHHSLLKAARFCGLGSDAVRVIPVDDQLRMNVEPLSARIQRDKSEGFAPFMVVATAGTTNAGAVDSIDAIAEIAVREQLWLHTDAAWGGAMALVPEFRPLIKGIELSDSITFDPHKLLSVTRGAGMYLTRRRGVLADTCRVATPYMPVQQSGGLDVVDPFMHSMQWSRRFIGLKLFLSLLVTGWEDYAEVIRQQVKLAKYLERGLRKIGWTVVNDPALAVVCFFDSTCTEGHSESYLESIAQEVKSSGRAWLSTTRIRNEASLRACISNFRSTENDVDVLLSELNRARHKLAGFGC